MSPNAARSSHLFHISHLATQSIDRLEPFGLAFPILLLHLNLGILILIYTLEVDVYHGTTNCPILDVSQ